MFNYKDGFMLYYKEQLSDMAAIPNSMDLLSCDMFVCVGREGEVHSEDSTAMLKLEFLDDSPHLGIEGFPAHRNPPPLLPLYPEV